MPKRIVTVKCPWCEHSFKVEIEGKYKNAEAIPQGGDLAEDVGHNQQCPECKSQLYIRYLS